ncbi:hypothetical protein VTL71DRAFT_3012 [Oculimacula yallundae]|uniref:Uncharacterized protein n=1 Tax=Oculimacula yallundae TaxID=86028 RepID=A0ABR4C5X8_9HELO
MQFLNLSVLLTLAASVSAVDISLRAWGNCDSRGGGVTCTNKNPNSCCGVPTGSYSSTVIYAVPGDWSLEFRGHEGGNCGRVKNSAAFRGGEYCLGGGPFTGAGYSFVSKKRRGEQAQEGTCSASGACTGTVAPDQLFLADGQKYNIVDMETGLFEELHGLMQNGSVKADIPAVFKTFEISA